MVRNLAEDADCRNHRLLEQTIHGLLNMFDAFKSRNLDEYQPANDAEDPDSHFGRRLKHAAQMLEEEPSPLHIEAVMVNLQNYDHHGGQVGDSAIPGRRQIRNPSGRPHFSPSPVGAIG
ncbi:hypothetical protein SCOR_30235 [Sulfidibacter corallicola]|uniref:Uncharacterized protein n=1 Tax=Sulfidibacter corallicola TaxID=2818388 RepID=A0A8A4TM28_SULCO|nr:hypothetical protein [Sulfidibacter corallicola]QTD50162.1 hypothetical protein J3U87_31645 [Sulfidibacter corallicola]